MYYQSSSYIAYAHFATLMYTQNIHQKVLTRDYLSITIVLTKQRKKDLLMKELNKIYNEDCLEGMKDIPNCSIDMILTSPPYDKLRSYNGIADEWSFDKFKLISKEIYRVLKKRGVCVWVVNDSTCNGSETGTSFKQALYFKEIGLRLHDTMIYAKKNYIPLTHKRYEQAFEYMFVFIKGKIETFNPIKIPCKGAGKIESYGQSRRKLLDKNQAMRAPEETTYMKTKNNKIHPNIFYYACGIDKTGHPAVFPYQLAEDHVISWSNENNIILDPFIGSGTTAIACLNTNRNYIGFELDKNYYDIANERIRKYKEEHK